MKFIDNLALAKQAKKDGKPHLVKMYFRNHCRQYMKKKKAPVSAGANCKDFDEIPWINLS